VNRFLRILVLLGIGLVAAGCSSDPTRGYSVGTIYRQGVSSVAVPIFSNDTFVRDMEFTLTDALVKEIQSRTPYQVTSEGEADTIVLGQIRDIQLDQLSKSRLTGLTEEGIISVTIDFQWKDLRSGKVLLERRAFTGHGLFVPSRPSSEPIELGRFTAVQRLVRDIVGEMQAEW
jgi:Lipopolysaccharide-assembly